MGGLFGGGKKKETKKEETTQKDLLGSNKEFVSLFNQGVSEGNRMNIPDYQVAEYSPEYLQALKDMAQGTDTTAYQKAQEYMTGIGESQLASGLGLQTQAQAKLTGIMNQTPEEFQKGYQAQYDSDLVRAQIDSATADINAERDQAIFGLNQSATSSGNMGSSRSGIAQGVIVGQAARAVGAASVQYRTAEEQNAMSRYSTYLNQQNQAAGSLASLAQSQISTGYSAYNAGMGYKSQYDQYSLQNLQNRINAGSIDQQRRQYMLDVQRQNYLQQQSPALARLSYMSPILSPLAGHSTSLNTKTTTTSSGGSGAMAGILGAAGTVAGAYFGSAFPVVGTEIGAKAGGMLGASIGGAM
ncbi:hypothetical protein E2L92_22005 [Salmonella enterica subsp. enterica serovar Ibadan]|nr:hypothetical protein [Salmonella enterica subsp. enterica serovar Ibadan]ECF3282127.1 hypothetical protein [Salmonella enterica subsp. enterica serovar Ibadan]